MGHQHVMGQKSGLGMSRGCQDDMSLVVIMSTKIDSSIIFNN